VNWELREEPRKNNAPACVNALPAIRPLLTVLHMSYRSIELHRGTTLMLERAAGAVIRLIEGNAWLSGGRSSRRMKVGRAIVVTSNGATLIYAIEASSLVYKAPPTCIVELRRRGEVRPTAARHEIEDAALANLRTSERGTGTEG
jgi:hypothetical protein